MNRLAILSATVIPLPALAHGGSHDVASPFSLEAWVAVPLLLSATLYILGVLRLWTRLGVGRGVQIWQAFCFAGGWILLAVALVSPMHRLGERLFAMHMLEHEILMTLAAPLLVLARPVGGILWALPVNWRRSVGGIGRQRNLSAIWRFLTDPVVATVVHGTAIWIWHIPVLFNAALASPVMHGFQHVSFFGSALLFWWALLQGRTRTRAYGAAAFYLFITALHSGFLGILLSVAREPIYPGQSVDAAAWGMSPLEDQQMAGLIMWVPAGVAYAAATLVMLGIWIARSSVMSSPGGRHAAASR
jgi:cytochrome c oxidase assembly factor CtaG